MEVRDCLAIVLAGGMADCSQGLVPKFFGILWTVDLELFLTAKIVIFSPSFIGSRPKSAK